jgi:hypothetical protein
MSELDPEVEELIDDISIALEVDERDKNDTGERITLEELIEEHGKPERNQD